MIIRQVNRQIYNPNFFDNFIYNYIQHLAVFLQQLHTKIVIFSKTIISNSYNNILFQKQFVGL